MNSNNSGSITEIKTTTPAKIKRRNFFYYLAAGAAGVYAVTRAPFNIFRSKVASASKITVKENPYAVKRETGKPDQGMKGRNNG